MAKVYLVTNPLRDFELNNDILKSTLLGKGIDSPIISYENGQWFVEINEKLTQVLEENGHLLGGSRNNSEYCLHFSLQEARPSLSARNQQKVSDDLPLCSGNRDFQNSTESEEVEEKTIEVRGVPDDIDLENVRLYFENCRKSGGGKIMGDLERDKITGTVLITFASSEDAIRVVKQREHTFDCQTFVVNMHQGSTGKQFFLSKVKNGLSKDSIINFLECKTEICVECIVKMEAENTWIVFCEDFVDLRQVQQLCMKHTLKFMSDTYPRVSPVPATDTILVKNVLPELEDMIRLYFKSCTDFKSVTKLSADRLLITFNNSSVVPKMCQKSHKVMDTELQQVIPYYKNLQVDGSYEDYELDSSYKLEFMKKYQDTFETILEPHLKPIWFKSNGSSLKIQFCKNSNREEGLKTLKNLLQNIHEEILKLSSPEMLAKAEQLIENKHLNAIVLLDSVNKTLAIVAFSEDIVLKLKEKLMSAGLSIGSASQTMPMESYKVNLMFFENFPQEMQEKYPGTLIERGQNKIIIKGNASNFSEVEKDVYKFLSCIQCIPVELAEHAARLLKNKQVKTYITKKFKEKKCTALWANKENGLIIVYSIKVDQLTIASDVLKSSIKALNFGNKDRITDVRNQEKWKIFLQDIQTNYANLFYLDEATLTGVTIDSVEDKIKDEFESFFQSNNMLEKFVSLEKVLVDYLRAKKMKDIDEFCQNFGTENPVTITICPDNQLSIIASAKNMDEAEVFVMSVINRFKEQKKSSSGKNLQSILELKYLNQMIGVYEGDMTQLSVGAIVNAANQEMVHGGGVAKAIIDKGSYEIQTECKDILASKNLKFIPVGEAIITSGGNLPCEYIIHAVGPIWSSGKNDDQKLLSKAVKRSLKIADSKFLASIAFPAISAGSYKYPLKEAVDVIISTVKKYLDKNPLTSLTTIYFVDTQPLVTSEFKQQIAWVFTQGATQKKKVVDPPKSVSKNPLAASSKSESKTDTTTKTLIIMSEELQKIKADIIVNSISNDLDFSKGKLSAAILESAGKEMQNECKKFKVLTIFQIIITKGHKLHCENVFHISLPYCKENARMIIRKYTEKCLKAADKYNASSIAFPSLGTGQLDYSITDVANVMIKTIYEHLNKASTSLKEVFIIIYPKDAKVFKAFQQESDDLKKSTGINLSTEKRKVTLEMSIKDSGKQSQGNSSNGKTRTENQSAQLNAQGLPAQVVPSPDFHFGAVQIFLINGDLLDEQTDAIVHCTDAKFGLRGGISKCLSAKCGKNFIQDCQNKASDMAKNHYVVTNAHHLKSEMILHLDVVSKLSEPEKILQTCIQVAEKYMLSSLSVPQLATNGKNVPLGEMAEAMVQVFSKLKSPFLKRVNVVLYQAKMIATLKDAISSSQKGNLIPAKAMKPADVFKISTLQKTDAEYKKVEKEFLTNLGRTATIKSIEKIINRPLKMQYEAQILKMKLLNPPQTINEHILWHGTKADCVMKICKDGFDRGYCGVNGTWHGRGVYFALKSEYSDKDMYTPRDAKGNKHMLMCNVGTGVYVQGTPDMKVLPTRPNSTEKYDSATNNPANPTVYIIFNDVQAYPDYYITYT